MGTHRRSREAAIVIPIFGLFLLLPPILSIFDAPVTVFGIPLLHVYVFSVWLGLVLAGLWLAGRLQDPDTDRTRPDEPTGRMDSIDSDDRV